VGFDFVMAVGGLGDGIVGVLAAVDVGALEGVFGGGLGGTVVGVLEYAVVNALCIHFLSVPKQPGLVAARPGFMQSGRAGPLRNTTRPPSRFGHCGVRS